MTHLTVEEIIEFVSFERITQESLALSARVNEHIRTCKSCREKVTAFREVYDELCRIGHIADFDKSIYKMVNADLLEALQEEEVREELRLSPEDRITDIDR